MLDHNNWIIKFPQIPSLDWDVLFLDCKGSDWSIEWMNEWCIYIALYCVLLYTQNPLQSCIGGGGGLSLTIHLDDRAYFVVLKTYFIRLLYRFLNNTFFWHQFYEISFNKICSAYWHLYRLKASSPDPWHSHQMWMSTNYKQSSDELYLSHIQLYRV